MDQNPQRTTDHPLSEKEINTDESKLSTTIAAVTDPKFPLPTLGEDQHGDTGPTTVLRYVLSFGTLSLLIATGLVGAWYLEIGILQTSQPAVVLSALFAVIMGALFLTGTVWIDWFELVLGYWWLSMPIGAAAGLILVLNQEASATLVETD